MTKLIVGLGNIGKKYEKTRHNVGFFIVDRLAQKHECQVARKKFKGVYGDFLLNNEKAYIVKPETFMNLSGECVAPWIDFLKIDGRDVLVIHDEIDLPLGRLRGQWRGSAGGNNGVASIIECLGRDEFCRLRVGIGRPELKSQVVSHVLTPFGNDELEIIDSSMKRAVEGAELFLEKGLDPMMQLVNKKEN